MTDVEIYNTDQHPVNSQIIDRATDNAVGIKSDTKLRKVESKTKQIHLFLMPKHRNTLELLKNSEGTILKMYKLTERCINW